MQSMLMTKANFEIDSLRGFVIESKTGDESIFQFSRVDSYIDSGYVAAISMIGDIKNRVESYGSTINSSEKRKKFTSKIPKPKLNDIEIIGVNNKQKKYFLKLIGDTQRFSNTKRFNRFYQCLLSNENAMNIYPEMEYDSVNRGFDLKLVITKTEPFNLKVGGYISSSGVNEGLIDLGYRFFGSTSKVFNIGAYFGTFYNSFSVDGKIEFPNKIPLYLKLDFLISRKNYFSNARYFFEDQFPAYIISDENYLDLSVGIPTGYSGALSAGVSNINASFQYYQDNYFSRTDTADVSNFYFISPSLEYEFNTLNKRLYPTFGHRFYIGLSYYSGNEKYTKGSGKSPNTEIKTNLNYYSFILRYLKYLELSRSISLGLSMEVGISSKPLMNNYISSLLMATPYNPLPVMKSLFLENYRANNYGAVGGTLDYNFYKRFNFRLEGYYYIPYEKLLLDDTDNSAYYSSPSSYHYAVASARFVYHPPIGVISASVNYIEKPGNKFGFLLNLGYLIFNKSKLNR